MLRGFEPRRHFAIQLLACGAVLLASCKPASVPFLPSYDASGCAASREPDTPGVRPQSMAAQCLVEHGLLVKVLALSDAPVFDEELANKINEVRQYAVYYLFPEGEEPAARGYLKLGRTPSSSSVIGFALERHFVRWPTKQALAPITLPELPRTGGFVAGIVHGFETPAAARSMRDPVARLRIASERRFGAYPVLEYLHEGAREFYRIAVPTERVESGLRAAAAPAAPTISREEVLDKLRAIEVVVVIDTTASMRPYIEALVERVLDLAGAVAALPNRPRVAFGLWGYRDRVPGIGYPLEDPVRDYTGGALLADLEAFRTRLRAIDLAPIGSEDEPECPFDGAMAAIAGSPWDRAAEKLVLLVGDNENHPLEHPKNPRRLTVDSVARAARAANVRISALYQPSNEVVKAQFEALAAANRGSAQASDDYGQLVQWIRTELEQRAAHIGRKLEAARLGPSAAPPRGMHRSEYVEIWEDLRRNLTAEELAGLSAPDRDEYLERRRRGRNVDLVWVERRSPGGVVLLREAEMITWAELKVLEYNLVKLRGLAGRDDDWIQRFLRERGKVATGETDDWLQADTCEPFDHFLRVRSVPIRRGLLSFTKDDLACMTAAERERLVVRLDAILSRLDLFHSITNFREQGDMRYGFLDMSVWDDAEGGMP